jgi:hypothetical protein
MNLKTFLPILSLLLLGTAAFARVHVYWPYDRLTQEADLIVIAAPVSVHDTTEKTVFPGVAEHGPKDGPSGSHLIPAIGVETTFAVSSVLKGDTNTTTFVFHHLREAESKLGYGSLGIVAFDPKEKKQFLLFLKRESDGRYAALTGQTDPDDSVKDLGTTP